MLLFYNGYLYNYASTNGYVNVYGFAGNTNKEYNKGKNRCLECKGNKKYAFAI
ncbi:MAG: hypothetical protein ACOX1R_09010 [Caldicoprobacterales bacterium]|jgi:hypothetical protein